MFDSSGSKKDSLNSKIEQNGVKKNILIRILPQGQAEERHGHLQGDPAVHSRVQHDLCTRCRLVCHSTGSRS
jgi:hypothetical protein